MIEIRVAFADTDAMGIVHHSNYLRYFEVARVGWLRRLGHDYRHWQERGIHMPLVESFCRYRKPARFEDILEVSVLSKAERLRVIFEYKIFGKESGELLTTGSTTHVAVDENLKVIALPEDFVSAINGGK